MTELEQQLTQSIERMQEDNELIRQDFEARLLAVQSDYDGRFEDVCLMINNIANSIFEKYKKRIPTTLVEQESEKICLECKHGKYTKYTNSDEKEQWKFSCIMDHRQKGSVVECTHYEHTAIDLL
ncbi:hypothetical protein EI167_19440 [Pseudoalteromonas prydzensis]|uniref:Uncharacterized protein n=1 Tax=Pseudoalteromonas prydzensis TaxID=182141 RepID=A0ABR9FRV5_9GAMM|nr:hypothetical protein [Pseudoalteromonas prydzensis]